MRAMLPGKRPRGSPCTRSARRRLAVAPDKVCRRELYATPRATSGPQKQRRRVAEGNGLAQAMSRAREPRIVRQPTGAGARPGRLARAGGHQERDPFPWH